MSLENIYDEQPYPRRAYPEAHPDRISSVARLHGLRSPLPEESRVLELGCGPGGNLLPIACAYPGGRFLGIELSRRQVEQACDWIDALGLENVEIRQMNILDMPETLGSFDYIIAHGVYSWVPEKVRRKMLEFAASHLSASGVAYFSYNTYPGWYPAMALREMVQYAAGESSSAAEKVQKARELLLSLERLIERPDDPHQQLLREHLQVLKDRPDVAILHDDLSEVNEPVYFHQFVADAESTGLQYVADADPIRGSEASLEPDVLQVLNQLTSDRICRQQFLDVLDRRAFRQSLVCQAGTTADSRPAADRLKGMLVSSNCKPHSAEPDVLSDAPEAFEAAGGRASTTNPVLKSALLSLSKAWPRSLPYEDLCSRVQRNLEGSRHASLDRLDHIHSTLSGMILDALSRSRILQLHCSEPRMEGSPTQNPVAFPFARLQARTSPLITNLWHQTVGIDDPFGRRILSILDGSHDRDSLLQTLLEDYRAGGLTLAHEGESISDPAQVRTALEGLQEQVLQRLATHALLVA